MRRWRRASPLTLSTTGLTSHTTPVLKLLQALSPFSTTNPTQPGARNPRPNLLPRNAFLSGPPRNRVVKLFLVGPLEIELSSCCFLEHTSKG